MAARPCSRDSSKSASRLLRRIYASLGFGFGFGSVEPFLDYLTGGPDWSLPIVSEETYEERAAAAASWQSNLALLDIGILSIVGEGDQGEDADAVTQIVADALLNSLWERQLRRFDDPAGGCHSWLVDSRTRHMWRTSTPSQRRGWFLAGLGADAGFRLSQVSRTHHCPGEPG